MSPDSYTKLMEASLIGKALNFGFSDYGFESRASKLHNYHLNYVFNHFNLNMAKKFLNFNLIYNKKNLKIALIFKKTGILKKYYFFKKNNFKFIKLFVFFYKAAPICKKVKIITTPTKTFSISFKALKFLHRRTNNSIYVLSTPFGLMSHFTAIKLKIGGKILTRISL
jgi:ribosomal protein S8